MNRLKAKARNLSISNRAKTGGEPTLLDEESSPDPHTATERAGSDTSRASSPSPTLQDIDNHQKVPQDWNLGV